MKKIIHHLRKQSESTKRFILNITLIIFGIILITIWVYTLGREFKNPDTQIKMKESLKPFDSLKENMIGGNNN